MMTEREYRAYTADRIRTQLEAETAKFILESVGCLQLFRELSWVTNHITLERGISIAEISRHADFEPFPLQLDFLHRESRIPDCSIRKLLREFGNSFANRFRGRHRGRGLGVIMPWHEEVVVLHHRPFWSQYAAIDDLKIDENCTLALHWFEPFICELAERCDMTDEATLIELEEGEWGPKDWRDYPEPTFV